jgi:hypothetical protein
MDQNLQQHDGLLLSLTMHAPLTQLVQQQSTKEKRNKISACFKDTKQFKTKR